MEKPKTNIKHLGSRTLAVIGTVIVASLGVASSAPAAATAGAGRLPIAGEISAGSGARIPIKQEGSVATIIHPDVHELTGSLEGLVTEFGTFKVDVNTGDGLFTAHGDFAGTVLGSKPGTAHVRLRARVTDLHLIEGRFVVSRGTDGLAGARAVCTFRYVVGEGGSYQGLAHLGKR